MSAKNTSHIYPPAVAALATAMLSVSLPHSTPIALRRLAAVLTEIAASKWSDATISALARQYTDWLALAHHLRFPIPALQEYEPLALLKMLTESEDVATCGTHPVAQARSPPRERPRYHATQPTNIPATLITQRDDAG